MRIPSRVVQLAVALAMVGVGLFRSLPLRAAVAAQQVIQVPPPPPVRDRVPLPQVGTAAIRGRVIDGQTGQSVPRARVRISGGLQPREMQTDDEGRFTFTGLPASPFSVTASKATYTTSSFPESGRTLRTLARPLALKDGEVRDDIVIRLYRSGAIVGRVVDAHGDPLDSAQISVTAVNVQGVPTGGGPGGGGSVNDIGEFRIGRLGRGRYVLRVTAPLGMRDPNMVESPPQSAPIPTYYPSAASRSEAQIITVGRGETVTGVDVVMREDMPTVIRGKVIAADGEPFSGPSGGGFISVAVDERAGAGYNMGSGYMGGGPIRPDGSFRLMLPPGDYVLEARRQQPYNSSAPRPQEQSGMTKVAVSGESMDVTITLGGGATAAGRILFEGTTPVPDPPARANAPLRGPGPIPCRSGNLEVASDWTFRIDGLTGVCEMPSMQIFGRWTVKSVTIGDRTMTSGSMAFEPGQHYDNVRILVSDRRSELNLHVTDDTGQPTREYVALVFPADREKWTSAASPFSPSFPRTFVPPTQEMLDMMRVPSPTARREAILGLPPGEYFAIALDDIETDRYRDADVLERLSASANRVTIAEGTADVALLRIKLVDLIRD